MTNAPLASIAHSLPPDCACTDFSCANFPRADFARALLDWFAIHRRPLPWRQSYDPYHTWIAEVMMQQTQMERGVVYFQRWMQRFPDIASVAHAPENDILRAWEGLGYYRRARYIQAAAQQICTQHHGVFPSKLDAIRALPGIGPYSAAAIASTAFEQDVACVDGNVERVLARIFDIDTPVRQAPAKGTIQALATALMPHGQARNYNQGMMELGALVCRKKADCAACPLASFCAAKRLAIVDERPIPRAKTKVTHAVVVAGVLRHPSRPNSLFVQRRLPDDRVWAGLWEFPGGTVEAGESPEQAIVREFDEEVAFSVRVVRSLGIIRHNYTKYQLSLHCFELELTQTHDEQNQPHAQLEPVPILREACDWRWAQPEDIDALPLPAAHRKLVDQLRIR